MLLKKTADEKSKEFEVGSGAESVVSGVFVDIQGYILELTHLLEQTK